MGAIDLTELGKIATILETSSKSLKKISQTLESTSPATPADEYFQILLALARVNEATEKLQRIVEKGDKKT